MSERKCVLIQSKVSPEVAARLDEIVEQYGFKSRYDVMQYILSAFLRVVDCDGEIDEGDKELLEFSKMFEGFENAKNRMITVRPTATKKVKLVDSINIYTSPGKTGYTCKAISIYGDDVKTNASVSNALDVLMKKLHTDLYYKLTEIGEDAGERRIERVIEMLVHDYTSDDKDKAYIQEEFEEHDGSIKYGIVPKRMNTKQYE